MYSAIEYTKLDWRYNGNIRKLVIISIVRDRINDSYNNVMHIYLKTRAIK